MPNRARSQVLVQARLDVRSASQNRGHRRVGDLAEVRARPIRAGHDDLYPVAGGDDERLADGSRAHQIPEEIRQDVSGQREALTHIDGRGAMRQPDHDDQRPPLAPEWAT